MSTTTPTDTSDSPELIAYEIYETDEYRLLPAPINRHWMDATPKRFAYRCLPMTIANQAGWIVTNPTSFATRWNGGPNRSDLQLVFDSDEPDDRITSLFGHGTVTFNLPYLFRTPRDVNLWVKGPSNQIKDAAQALEGVVETDWACSTFTMNWKLTRPGHLVRFERGEPICMIVPVPRQLTSELRPVRKPLSDSSETHAEYHAWSEGRNDFHRRVDAGDDEARSQGWQRDYFRGKESGSEIFEGHQTKLSLKPFAEGP